MNIRAESPCEVVRTDLLTWDNKDYLVTVYYFSGFYEIDRLHSTTSNAVIKRELRKLNKGDIVRINPKK